MDPLVPILPLESRFARELEGLHTPWRAARVPAPAIALFNDALAGELGLDAGALTSPLGVELLAGHAVAEGSTPVAMAYAGHQFGNYSPRLGDGRALLLGELVDARDRLRDVHLKGSGRTPYARGGDGKAAIGPMLREYLIGEAMHALGIPTTRALAVFTTGEKIERETPLPGAILVRIAASHLRVGTFEYAAARGDLALLRRLANHAIARHAPQLAAAPSTAAAGVADRADRPYLAFLESFATAQAELVARWMLVGFVHGVMNTDNTAISGETIDYGPCAFMERHDPKTVFSSIDQHGRYAYGNQPGILQWNLARFAEALLPLIDDDADRAVEAATAVLGRFAERFVAASRSGMRAKLGVGDGTSGDDGVDALVDGVPALLTAQRVDHTLFFRRLADAVRGDDAPVRALFADPNAFDAWAPAWRGLLPVDPSARTAVAGAMDRVNPIYIPRNLRVEEALEAATGGDLAPGRALLDAITRPFDERPGLERFAEPAPPDAPRYRTFCGT